MLGLEAEPAAELGPCVPPLLLLELEGLAAQSAKRMIGIGTKIIARKRAVPLFDLSSDFSSVVSTASAVVFSP